MKNSNKNMFRYLSVCLGEINTGYIPKDNPEKLEDKGHTPMTNKNRHNTICV